MSKATEWARRTRGIVSQSNGSISVDECCLNSLLETKEQLEAKLIKNDEDIKSLLKASDADDEEIEALNAKLAAAEKELKVTAGMLDSILYMESFNEELDYYAIIDATSRINSLETDNTELEAKLADMKKLLSRCMLNDPPFGDCFAAENVDLKAKLAAAEKALTNIVNYPGIREYMGNNLYDAAIDAAKGKR